MGRILAPYNQPRWAGNASGVPFLATPGNHEYYESPIGDRYNQPGSQRAISRYQTYFEFPTNHAPNANQRGLYHRTDFGPITLIALDVANDGPHKTDRDTNFFLLGEDDEQGGNAPAFKPGSTQYTWLEEHSRCSATQRIYLCLLSSRALLSRTPRLGRRGMHLARLVGILVIFYPSHTNTLIDTHAALYALRSGRCILWSR